MRSSRRFSTSAVVLLIAGSVVAAAAADRAAGARVPRLPGKIAFVSDVDGDNEIFVMRADGSNRRQVTFNRVNDWEPSWSPDGRRLIFERERATGWEDLMILEVATGEVEPWVRSASDDEGDADWSPDGEWIAFKSNDEGEGSESVVMRVDKTDGANISSDYVASSNTEPTWSPDGTQIAMVSAYKQSSIDIITLCCSRDYDRRSITLGQDWEYALDWSPDGTCIVYAGEGGSDTPIYTVRVDGGKPKLISDSERWAHPGPWSPDGSQILFDSHEGSSYDLYLMDADGSDVRRLTRTDKVDEHSPAWWAPPVADPATPDCGRPAPSPSPSPSPSVSPAP